MNGSTVAILIAISGSWVTLVGLVLGLVVGQGRSIKKELGDRVAGVEAGLGARITALDESVKDARREAKADNLAARQEAKADNLAARQEAREGLQRLEAVVAASHERLDARIYALAAGLRPLIEAAQNPAAS